MKLKLFGSAIFSTGLMFAACGGDDGGGGDTPAQAVTAIVDQTCSTAFECRDSFPTDMGFAFEDLFGTTEAECTTTFTDIFDPQGVQASVDAGRVIYDAGDAATCLAAGDDLSCDQFWGTTESPDVAACDTQFVGTIADGGACTIDLDCTGAQTLCDEETLICTPDA